MQATFETAIKAIESLSAEDYARFVDWFREKYGEYLPQPSNQAANLLPSENEGKERIEKYRLAMKWIDEHRQEYLRQWVCLDGARLVSHGAEAKAVYQAARQAGIKIPFIERVEEVQTAPVSEGWE